MNQNPITKKGVKMKKLSSIILGLFIVLNVTKIFASPIYLPEMVKGKEGLFLAKHQDWSKYLNLTDEGGISFAYVYDHLSERKLKEGGKATADMMGGKITLSFLNRFDIYTVLGQLQNPDFKENILGSDVKASLEDKFIWSVGAGAIIYEWEEKGIKIFADGNYRKADDIELESVTVDGTTYSKSQLGGTSVNAKWEEWQAALGISKELKYFIPYVGVKYSDVKASAKATVSGTTYDFGSVRSEGKVGPFIGVSIIPVKSVSIDICGRFVDEQAVSAAVTVRF